jgi:putative peptide zinc metalloprotease protein
MSETSRKVALPAYLVRRCEAFRVVSGAEHSYVVRDKVQNKTWDFDPWQFFILEVLPGCESVEKLQTAFRDRFNRTVTNAELEEFFATVADHRLLNESALQHPLLSVFARRTYDVVDGKPVARPHSSLFAHKDSPAAPSMDSEVAEAVAEAQPEEEVLAAGVQDVPGSDRRTADKMIDLFDPRPILRFLAPALAPLRYVGYAFPVMLLAAVLVLIQHWQSFATDVGGIRIAVGLGGHLLFALLTVNLASVIVRACIAHNYGAQVESFGIMFFAGFAPRFDVGIRHLGKLSREQRMWYHGGNLLIRGVLLCVGVLAWFFTIDKPGSAANDAGLLLALTSWTGLVIETGNPFIRGSTYFLLATYMDEPKLRVKARRALMSKIHRKVYQQADNNLLAAYGLACIAYTTLLIIFLTLAVGNWLSNRLGIGIGVYLAAAALCGYVVWRTYKQLKKVGAIYQRSQEFDRWRSRTLVTEDAAEGEPEVPKKHYWRYVALLCLLLLLLIPYQYDVTGSVEVYPYRKQQISTDTPGLIDQVNFDGGESVKKGTVIATLAHEDYNSQIKVTEAEIAAQAAVVANLKSLPKPQEIELAQEALRVAQTQASFSVAKVPRLQALYNQGAVPLEDLETARKEAHTDVQQVQEKQAALALAKTGPTADQIAAAEAKLASLQAQKALYEDKLARTTLRMPFDGNILTLHLKDRINSYLNQGDPFAEVEYTGKVTAQIDIDESDLQYVKVGSTVRLRPTAYFNREFDGVVTKIGQSVTSTPTGTYAAVIATFQNEDGSLKTGMTGEAKIDGPTIPVWRAFTQSIQRFVQVEVWSWVP